MAFFPSVLHILKLGLVLVDTKIYTSTSYLLLNVTDYMF